ncbi:hypothetical protein IFM89_006683 [Coptis chinensis]|uniref:Ergosterol biosynthetic protein 28 n=1 Tax=Coptis chinensis TaxID=261450 RepID=A0A835ITR2_9MAGN|nr:hypothetical protein IFM89_006683 [Coptis chinensis]
MKKYTHEILTRGIESSTKCFLELRDYFIDEHPVRWLYFCGSSTFSGFAFECLFAFTRDLFLVMCLILRIFDSGLLGNRFFTFALSRVTDVHGRTFGVWTLLTCTLCFLCAFNLENKLMHAVTFLSFIYALGHFLSEFLIYHTMAIANLTTIGFFAGFHRVAVYGIPFGPTLTTPAS